MACDDIPLDVIVSNAFNFTNKDGKARYGRYQFRPEAGERYLAAEDAAKQPADFLASDDPLLEARSAAYAISRRRRKQCSGNSRSLFEPRVAGAQWQNGAMGNARWAGVGLARLLRAARARRDAVQVTFDGMDEGPLASVPDFVKALDIDHALRRRAGSARQGRLEPGRVHAECRRGDDPPCRLNRQQEQAGSGREALAEGEEQAGRSVETDLPRQQRPDEAPLPPQEPQPRSTVRRHTQIR